MPVDPLTAAAIIKGLDLGGSFLLSKWLKPEPEPVAKPSNELELPVTPMRYHLGQVRVTPQWVWANGVFGTPGDRDPQELWLIGVMGEGAMESIERMWIEGNEVPLTRATNKLTPSSGQYKLTARTPNPESKDAFEVYEYFKADGTEGVEMRTPAIPATRRYSQTGDADTSSDWSTTIDERDEYYQDLEDGSTTEYQEPQLVQYEQKPWGASHKLNGLSYVGVKLFQPYYDSENPDDNNEESRPRVWRRIPKIEFLVKGKKITWPGQATPAYTENPVCWWYWYDTERRGLPASKINVASFTAAMNKCDEDVTIPAASIPDTHAYLRTTQAGARVTKRYFGGMTVESGQESAEVYARIRAACVGYRFQDAREIHYRVGQDRASSLTLVEADFADVREISPWPSVDSRVNSFNATLSQSERNGFLRDTTSLVDAAAQTRDGSALHLDVQLHAVFDEIVAARILYILLRRQRESLTFVATVGAVEGMAHLDALPGDAWTVTHRQVGLTAAKCEVVAIVKRPDGYADVTLKLLDDGVYADTLVLPELRPRPVRFVSVKDAGAIQGLALSAFAETQVDGGLINYLVATWTGGRSVAAEARYRRRESIFTAPVSVASGVYYRVTNLRPFLASADDAAEWTTSQTNRWGIWLQYRGGDVASHLLEARWSAMAGGGDTGAPEYPILNSAPGGGETRNIKFRRFGVFATNARSDFANRTAMEFSFAGGNQFASNYRFTAARIRDWRIVMRDSSGVVFTMMLPATSEDPDNPFRWTDSETTGLRTFLTNARDNDRTVDVTVADGGVTALDLATRSTLLAASLWRPMEIMGSRAQAPGVVEGDTYDAQVRNVSPDAGRGPWQNARLTITGDLAPPSAPTGLVAESAPGGGYLSWIPSPEPDVAFYEVLTSATNTGGFSVLDSTPSAQWAFQGPPFTVGVQRFIRVRAVDRRGNRSALSVYADFVPQAYVAGSGTVIRTGTAVPTAQLGTDGDYYIRTPQGDAYFKIAGAWVLVQDLTPTTGAAIYVIDIADDANPMAGTTSLSRGGTIPAAANIPAGSVAIDTSDGRLWDWDGSDFVFRGSLKGSENHSGSGVPANTLGQNGDLYVDTATGNVYIKAVGAWALQFDLTTIEGSQVFMIDIAANATPAAGSTTLQRGGTIPAAADILPGSVAIDASDGRIWDWITGTSTFVFRGTLKGADNLSGAGAPAATLGINGDMYVDTNTGNVYIKANDAWALTFDLTTIEGAAVYMINIPDATLLPVAGTTTLLRGGTIPAAANISPGSVAVDASDGRIWEWNATTMAFVFRGRLAGQRWDVETTRPAMCQAGDKRVDGDGNVWVCDADGMGETFTGVVIPPNGSTGTTVTQDCVFHRVGAWPPPTDLGTVGHGAYTGGGLYGARTASGWPASPTGTFGGATGTKYLIQTVESLPAYPPIAGAERPDLTIVRILLTGDIYRLVTSTGNWILIGNLCDPGGVPIRQDPPDGLTWSTPQRNADGTYTATLSWSAPPGAVDFFVTLSPQTPTFVSDLTQATSIEFTDLPADSTITGFVDARGENNAISATVGQSVLTGASGINLPGAPLSFRATVDAITGNVTLAWANTTVNANLITHSILEVRQGGVLYRDRNITGRVTLSALFPRTPVGTYSAALVHYTQGGPGPAATIATITVPTRVAPTWPPPVTGDTLGPITNYRTFGQRRNQFQGQRFIGRGYNSAVVGWQPPIGRVPTGYVTWGIGPLTISQPRVVTGSGSGVTAGGVPYILTAAGSGYRPVLPSDIVMIGRTIATYPDGWSEVATDTLGIETQRGSAIFGAAPTGLTVTQSRREQGRFDVDCNVAAGTGLRGVEYIVYASGQPIAVQTVAEPNTMVTFRNIPTRQVQVQARRADRYGLSPAAMHTFSVGAIEPEVDVAEPVARVSAITATGATVTATVGKITDPNSAQLDPTAIEWFVALASSPDTPIAAYPTATDSTPTRDGSTSREWVFALAGLASGTAHVFRARARAGTSAPYNFSSRIAAAINLTGAVVPQAPPTPASVRNLVSGTLQGSVTIEVALTPRATLYNLKIFRVPNAGQTIGGTLVAQTQLTAPNRRWLRTAMSVGHYWTSAEAENAGGKSPGTAKSAFTISRIITLGPAPPPHARSPRPRDAGSRPVAGRQPEPQLRGRPHAELHMGQRDRGGSLHLRDESRHRRGPRAHHEQVRVLRPPDRGDELQLRRSP